MSTTTLGRLCALRRHVEQHVQPDDRRRMLLWDLQKLQQDAVRVIGHDEAIEANVQALEARVHAPYQPPLHHDLARELIMLADILRTPEFGRIAPEHNDGLGQFLAKTQSIASTVRMVSRSSRVLMQTKLADGLEEGLLVKIRQPSKGPAYVLTGRVVAVNKAGVETTVAYRLGPGQEEGQERLEAGHVLVARKRREYRTKKQVTTLFKVAAEDVWVLSGEEYKEAAEEQGVTLLP